MSELTDRIGVALAELGAGYCLKGRDGLLEEAWDRIAELEEERGELVAALKESERLLEMTLPEWADEVDRSSGNACCELSEREVVTIRDFLRMRAALAKADGKEGA